MDLISGLAGDGREMLVCADEEVVRMAEVDEQGRCRFGKVGWTSALSRRRARGSLWRDVQLRVQDISACTRESNHSTELYSTAFHALQYCISTVQ